jgi:hypothetical protein
MRYYQLSWATTSQVLPYTQKRPFNSYPPTQIPIDLLRYQHPFPQPITMHIPALLAFTTLFALTTASPLNLNPYPTPTPSAYTTDCTYASPTTCGNSTVTPEMCDSGSCTCDASGSYNCPDVDSSCTGAMLQAVCAASFQCSCVVLEDPCPGFEGCGVGPGHGWR